jgi:hypothetical protein
MDNKLFIIKFSENYDKIIAYQNNLFEYNLVKVIMHWDEWLLI